MMRFYWTAVLFGLLLECAAGVQAQHVSGADVRDRGDVAVGSDTGGAGRLRPLSVGLLLGYGLSLGDDNPWGLGFGLRAGVDVQPIYLGGRFVYYLGERRSAAGSEAPVDIWELGAEGGYDLDVGDLVVRPGLGIGVASLTYDSIALDTPGSVSHAELYVASSVCAMVDVADEIFIGVEARLKVLVSDPTFKAITLLASSGLRF